MIVNVAVSPAYFQVCYLVKTLEAPPVVVGVHIVVGVYDVVGVHDVYFVFVPFFFGF